MPGSVGKPSRLSVSVFSIGCNARKVEQYLTVRRASKFWKVDQAHFSQVKASCSLNQILSFPFSLAGEIFHQEETLPEVQREDAVRRLHAC